MISSYVKDKNGNISELKGSTIKKANAGLAFQTASYDDKTGTLKLHQVQAGGNTYYLELQEKGDYIFDIITYSLINVGAANHDANYQFDLNKLSIAEVFAFGEYYSVELHHPGNWRFAIKRIEPDQ